MSDAPKEDAAPEKKKGGKLPIIMALVLMLGGGGFFMMKKGGHKEKPKIKLAKEESLLPDEFIVNMADGHTYVRAKIGIKTMDGFKAEEVASHESEVCDAINSILKTTSPADIVSEEQVHTLKIRIAKSLNKIFKEAEPKEDEEDSKKDKKKKDEESDSDSKKSKSKSDESSDDTSDKKKDSESDKTDEPEIPEGWDSAKGPVLKVFFKSLATQ